MKCSFNISNFLEEISSLSHFSIFLYFLALFTYVGFLFSSCCSLQLCIQLVYLSHSSLIFAYHIFSAITNKKASSAIQFAFFHFLSIGMVLVTTCFTMLQTSVHSSPSTLSSRSRPLYLFIISIV